MRRGKKNKFWSGPRSWKIHMPWARSGNRSWASARAGDWAWSRAGAWAWHGSGYRSRNGYYS